MVKLSSSDQLRVVGVDAAHLVHRHLPLFELRGLLILGRSRKQQVAAGLLLVGQSGGIDRGQPHQKFCSAASQSLKAFTEKSLILSLKRLSPIDRCEFGRVLEIGFPVFVEEVVERLAAVFHRRTSVCLRPSRKRKRETKEGRSGQGKEVRIIFEGK